MLADRGRQGALLSGGLVALIVADLILAHAGSVGAVLAGTAVWGLHMGLTQGVLAALVAQAAPADLRGTAFGLFNLVSGVALLVASALAGWLWAVYGPTLTFYAGAAFTGARVARFVAAAPPGCQSPVVTGGLAAEVHVRPAEFFRARSDRCYPRPRTNVLRLGRRDPGPWRPTANSRSHLAHADRTRYPIARRGRPLSERAEPAAAPRRRARRRTGGHREGRGPCW